jgi:hypothetical protein
MAFNPNLKWLEAKAETARHQFYLNSCVPWAVGNVEIAPPS